MVSNSEKSLKAFVIFLSDDKKKMETDLSAIAKKLNANEISLAYLSPKSNAIKDYKINMDPVVHNTVMIYRNRRVTANFVNLGSDDKSMKALKDAIAETVK